MTINAVAKDLAKAENGAKAAPAAEQWRGTGRRVSREDSGIRPGVGVDGRTEVMGERASNAGVVLFSAVLFLLVFLAVFALGWFITDGGSIMLVIVSVLVATLAAMGIHIAQQWEWCSGWAGSIGWRAPAFSAPFPCLRTSPCAWTIACVSPPSAPRRP